MSHQQIDSAISIRGEHLVQELVGSAGLEMLRAMSLAPEKPFGGQQAFDADRAPGVDSTGADANLRARTFPINLFF